MAQKKTAAKTLPGIGSIMSIQDQVLALLKEILGAEITAGSSTTSVQEWDSVKYVEIVAALEEKYGIEFGSEELVELNSVEAITAILQKRGGE